MWRVGAPDCGAVPFSGPDGKQWFEKWIDANILIGEFPQEYNEIRPLEDSCQHSRPVTLAYVDPTVVNAPLAEWTKYSMSRDGLPESR